MNTGDDTPNDDDRKYQGAIIKGLFDLAHGEISRKAYEKFYFLFEETDKGYKLTLEANRK